MAFKYPDLSQEVIELALFIREKGIFFMGGGMPMCDNEEEKIACSWGILSLSSRQSRGHNCSKGSFLEAKITLGILKQRLRLRAIKIGFKQDKQNWRNMWWALPVGDATDLQ